MDLYTGPDGRQRCPWARDDLLMSYHDTEWGVPVRDDRGMFERICLEGFQAGLSWRTILAKRDAFRAAFANFDVARVAAFTDDDIAHLLANPAIVRNRRKIVAVVTNAQRAVELAAAEGSLAEFCWGFQPAADELGEPHTRSTCPSAQALAKELKRRGWSFVGPTTVFALMQAAGIVDDHAIGCFRRGHCDG